jgi:hypothetical protein
MSALTQILHRFQRFGPEQASGPFGSPLYVVLCSGLADDPETASLLLQAAPVQRIPNLLLAAVHDLLLSGGEAARHRLARYYPSVVREAVAPDDLTYATFRAFCATYRGEILIRVRGRSTQTNEHVVRPSCSRHSVWSHVNRGGPWRCSSQAPQPACCCNRIDTATTMTWRA